MLASPCAKGLNSSLTRSAAIPMPVSCTEMRSIGGWLATISPRTVMDPASVNFTAFDSRFRMICFSRVGSVVIGSARLAASFTSSFRPLSWAFCRDHPQGITDDLARVAGMLSATIIPASILARSSVSLITASRWARCG